MASDYSSRLESRRAFYAPRHDNDQSRTSTTSEPHYSIDSIYSIPHSSQIHAFACSDPCSSHLYTGSSDGFIRRYNLFATLNGTKSTTGGGKNELMNLTMKQGNAGQQQERIINPPVLTGYWENEEPAGEWMDDMLPIDEATNSNEEKKSKIKWGTKTMALGNQSAVYSLAVQRDELWGLSGTSKGSINLFTIRTDEGQIRHVFRPVEPTAPATGGHSNKSPVSVLTLDSNETSFLSGGWDGRIFDWDLNTGQSKRSFLSHGPNRQISSISYRPISTASSTSRNGDVDMRNLGGGDSPLSEASNSSSKGVAEKLVSKDGAGESDIDADGEMDADADGEIDDTFPTTTASSSLNGTATVDRAKSIKLVGDPELSGEISKDCFLSTSLDGLVLIWDKRVNEGEKGVVRKFGDEGYSSEETTSGGKKKKANERWCTSACWSPTGDQIHVARRSSLFETYDLRHSNPLATYALPTSTGPISSISALANGTQVVTASWDCLRVWDLNVAEKWKSRESTGENGSVQEGKLKRSFGGKGVQVVSGHYGGTISAIHIDPYSKWMFTTSGSRGWEGNSTENLVIHELKLDE